MKREQLSHFLYNNLTELKDAVDEYIYFYNEERPHASLGNLTPNQMEEKYYSEKEKTEKIN